MSIAAQTQTLPEPITLRAVHPVINDDVIRYIAKNAQPFHLEASNFTDNAYSTPAHIITRLCGSVRDAYYSEFLVANQLKALPKDQPLGDQAKTLVWPACLYTQLRLTKASAVIRPMSDVFTETIVGNTASRNANIAVEGKGPPTVPTAVGGMGLPVTEPSLDKTKKSELGPHATLPVDLVPKVGNSKNFLLGLERAASSDGKAQNIVQHAQSAEGEIVVAVPYTGGVNSTEPERTCIPLSGPPFDAAVTERAYRFAKEQRRSLPIPIMGGQAEVTIVDNGFFGAKQQPSGSSFFTGSPFPAEYFMPDPKTIIARRVELGERIDPINSSRDLVPDHVSGHGTHVTGLVLGGPNFFPYHSKLQVDGNPWALLTIINVGKGSSHLVPGAPSILRTVLNVDDNRSRIVNLSIAYKGFNTLEVKKTFEDLIFSGTNLFITSAGNDKRLDVSQALIYPAALGGMSSRNVISVAALDGEGRLTRFTNHGSNSVDLAAPGCEIASWIANTSDVTFLSGTSQAAPLVTFGATLLRSLAVNSRAWDLKSRLVVSGDLLINSDDQSRIAYRVMLNIPKSLYWFSDYVRLNGPVAGEYVGEIRRLEGLICADDEKLGRPHPISNLWAFKRDTQDGWIFFGKASSSLFRPCAMAKKAAGLLVFVPTHRIGPDKIESWPNAPELKLSLEQIDEIVLKTEFHSN